MKKIISLLLILICFQNLTSFGQLKLLKEIAEDIADETQLDELNSEHVEAMPFSIEEAANAVKEALSKGIKKGVQKVNKEDGYFKNPLIKIPAFNKGNRMINCISGYKLQK